MEEAALVNVESIGIGEQDFRVVGEVLFVEVIELETVEGGEEVEDGVEEYP